FGTGSHPGVRSGIRMCPETDTRMAARDQLTLDLPEAAHVELGPGAWVLRGFALAGMEPVLEDLRRVTRAAPFRHMITPGGFRMSVAMTNCGPLGWVSDESGYRYSGFDPESGGAWPALPETFRRLAARAAERAGFMGFEPDACLVNRYEPGARLSLHQDKDERDFEAPIVSVSLGLPAVFLWGGAKRADRASRVPLVHGDVVAWGGPARLRYHGVLALKDGEHPLLGRARINLTFRKAA
ncbi:MAG TPA: DNA oxidative demethylase AlkB, partial [Polyangiaceae bacterium]|nr:DNA oxidative demethylase AlkB [Polyangiaceae bacterium]